MEFCDFNNFNVENYLNDISRMHPIEFELCTDPNEK